MLKWKYRQKKRFFFILMRIPKPLDWLSQLFAILYNRIHMFFWEYWAKLKFAEMSFESEVITVNIVNGKVVLEDE